MSTQNAFKNINHLNYLLHPTHRTKKWERTTCESIDGEDDHFSLPEGVEPLFWMSPYNTLSTAAGLGLRGLHYNKL
ncbi:hypothetical protein BDL97_04G097700 [Sphagnum fallax]|nr:hypothetical protein BDL97_04G097700 [Sphagnum fallax]